ncbi:MDR family MFS transporter [Acididesulfobacillus acetoxydans]|uniref:MDR family MFS transporter n=1 Tax=Acididesulfobacillus acetoxydans TaxID=1561005 RepID=UPI001F1107BB|nr:MDR family MFS transporter [Acididesulfobacillus acetoxydans]
MFKRETVRVFVLVSVMLAMFMAAVEGTIVATAMPSIVGDLGGFTLFSWVFSAFLLAQTVTIPIYGKLADLYGRKPVFVLGVVVFLAGSTLCGLATSMNQLIFYRLIQGVGAGAVQPIATTIVGDIYNLEERAQVQGYLSGVWGFASIIGPAVGGLFVQYARWSWVFWINIPVGLLSALGIILFFRETVTQRAHKVDYLGSGLIFVAISALMVVLIQAGTVWPWGSAPVLGLLAVFAAGSLLFVVREKRATEPVMPLEIWHDRLITVANLASLTTGIVLVGIDTFLPTFVQGVMNKTPIVAGFALAVMSIGWTLSATVAGRMILRLGYRRTALGGGLWLVIGSVFFVTLQPSRGWFWAAGGSFLVGVGMGLARTVFIVAVQSSVAWEMRGAATAANMFTGILGNTVGAALLGGVLNNRMTAYLRHIPAGQGAPLNLDVVNALLDPQKRQSLSAEMLRVLQRGLTISLHTVYWGVMVLSFASLFLIYFLPRRTKEESQ